MKKFKVGDVVQCINAEPDHTIKEDKIYTVDDVIDSGKLVSVEGDFGLWNVNRFRHVDEIDPVSRFPHLTHAFEIAKTSFNNKNKNDLDFITNALTELSQFEYTRCEIVNGKWIFVFGTTTFHVGNANGLRYKLETLLNIYHSAERK